MSSLRERSGRGWLSLPLQALFLESKKKTNKSQWTCSLYPHPRSQHSSISDTFVELVHHWSWIKNTGEEKDNIIKEGKGCGETSYLELPFQDNTVHTTSPGECIHTNITCNEFRIQHKDTITCSVKTSNMQHISTTKSTSHGWSQG